MSLTDITAGEKVRSCGREKENYGERSLYVDTKISLSYVDTKISLSLCERTPKQGQTLPRLFEDKEILI